LTRHVSSSFEVGVDPGVGHLHQSVQQAVTPQCCTEQLTVLLLGGTTVFGGTPLQSPNQIVIDVAHDQLSHGTSRPSRRYQ